MKKIWGYWYTLLFIAVVGLAQFGALDGFEYSGPIDGAPLHVQVAIPVVLVSMFGFFFLMLADFFSNKDVKHPVIVGFLLLFFNWVAILIYFWLVVNRRAKI